MVTERKKPYIVNCQGTLPVLESAWLRESHLTTVRVTCPGCGPVDVDPPAISVVPRGPDEGEYHFVCPVCWDIVDKKVNDVILNILLNQANSPIVLDWDELTTS